MGSLQTYHTIETTVRQSATTPALLVGDWKARALQLYQHQRQIEELTLRKELIRCLYVLVGREVRFDAIYVDLEQRAALTTVDGTRFQLAQGQLTLLLPCGLCGLGQFASPALTSLADIGYALSTWQPHHPECQPDDGNAW